MHRLRAVHGEPARRDVEDPERAGCERRGARKPERPTQHHVATTIRVLDAFVRPIAEDGAVVRHLISKGCSVMPDADPGREQRDASGRQKTDDERCDRSGDLDPRRRALLAGRRERLQFDV